MLINVVIVIVEIIYYIKNGFSALVVWSIISKYQVQSAIDPSRVDHKTSTGE